MIVVSVCATDARSANAVLYKVQASTLFSLIFCLSIKPFGSIVITGCQLIYTTWCQEEPYHDTWSDYMTTMMITYYNSDDSYFNSRVLAPICSANDGRSVRSPTATYIGATCTHARRVPPASPEGPRPSLTTISAAPSSPAT